MVVRSYIVAAALLAGAAACSDGGLGRCDPACPAGAACVGGDYRTLCQSDTNCPSGRCVNGVCEPLPPGSCSRDSDCTPGPCQEPVGAQCIAGQCRFVATRCADVALACTAPDILSELQGACDPATGECVTVSTDLDCPQCPVGCGRACTPEICDDRDPCTADACDAMGACSHDPTGDACDDADACTAGDACGPGGCAGEPYTCDDDNACTVDTCNGDGTCTFAAWSGACDDGDPCTQLDACRDGTCAGTRYSCGSTDPCVVAACDGAGGCLTEYVCVPGAPATVGIAGDPCRAEGRITWSGPANATWFEVNVSRWNDGAGVTLADWVRHPASPYVLALSVSDNYHAAVRACTTGGCSSATDSNGYWEWLDHVGPPAQVTLEHPGPGEGRATWQPSCTTGVSYLVTAVRYNAGTDVTVVDAVAATSPFTFAVPIYDAYHVGVVACSPGCSGSTPSEPFWVWMDAAP